MIRYVVTHFPGVMRVNLSRVGEWGNVPHRCGVDALAAIKLDAGSSPFTIEQKTSRRSFEEA